MFEEVRGVLGCCVYMYEEAEGMECCVYVFQEGGGSVDVGCVL